MSDGELLLGIDIGTSACKTAVFDIKGNVITMSDAAYSLYFPKARHVEQNPEDWWHAVCYSVKKCVLALGKLSKNIVSIGITGQSWAAVALDFEGKVLCNTPIWMDTRENSFIDNYIELLGEDNLFRLTGNPFRPGYTIPKVIWYRENMKDVYKRTYKFLQSNGYIAYKLTGFLGMDKSQGNGLHIFNINDLCYDDKVCMSMELDRDKFPDITDSCEIVGVLSKKAAELTGLLPGIPVVAGGLDAACAALGCGVYKKGQTHFQAGSSAVLSACMDKPVKHKKLILSAHVVPGTWILQGGTSAFSGSFKWFGENFGYEESIKGEKAGKSVYAMMDVEAEKIPVGSEGLIYLPYLSGERSPVWDDKAKGVLIGLDYSKSKAHVIRAILEGCAYSIYHNYLCIEEAGGEVQTIFAGGGGSVSKLWMQMVSDMLCKNIKIIKSETASCLGAALLAGTGIGLYNDCEEAAKSVIGTVREHEPDLKNTEIYMEGFELYKKLYEANKDIMKKL